MQGQHQHSGACEAERTYPARQVTSSRPNHLGLPILSGHSPAAIYWFVSTAERAWAVKMPFTTSVPYYGMTVSSQQPDHPSNVLAPLEALPTLSASSPVAYHTKALHLDSCVSRSLSITSSLTVPMLSKICEAAQRGGNPQHSR